MPSPQDSHEITLADEACDGKVISVARWTVGSDGKTMTLKVEDKLRGSNSQFTATKQ